MPCHCWYDPPDESKRVLKKYCQQIVDEVKRLEKQGDPIGCEMKDIHKLLDHLYRPSMCRGKI